jgi:hypothetical protein
MFLTVYLYESASVLEVVVFVAVVAGLPGSWIFFFWHHFQRLALELVDLVFGMAASG